MTTQQIHQVYKQNSVSTASPGELTLMLYNGCLKFLNKAKQAMREGNIQERNTNLQKAQRIIQELMATLNQKYEIAKQMMIMYEYMNRRLIEANIKNDISIVEEVEGFVAEFRDTWEEVIRLTRQKQFKGDQV
ncbi:flagellar export chaperone FliS [Parageobacillus thermoglucosidasius]|uniref:Flagellar secretion chaperone FliS n=1 Tax=Parageobacillus thermoglucosidasius TaxID=1426 RepID=A0AAN0YKZ8_PARTM|nr:flagellar export chaperone FliS [Parageobacillus thermoglucosidasius]ALF08741.1 flagellar export chaperone FliS [Parageobacillus thermoglucosidasius]ANZ28823.1 flagellar export chaperone FliS [Parageobacillus thermoglucosidasius]APM79560.1 flagellar export chaperone FliS [Parageobacillus thermoglucosidasius]KJX68328.1 flagellar biosynthesis protein FliS [Parageobacillus thermoglucosidasius]MBY6270258.1 flagella export chaperone FliS [Parageobacillus thermoglucosidasius]